MLKIGGIQKRSNRDGEAKKSVLCKSHPAHQRATTISRTARAVRREFSHKFAAFVGSARRAEYRAQSVKATGEIRIKASPARSRALADAPGI